MVDIANLIGYTGKIGREDVQFGKGDETFSVPTAAGGTVNLTKIPSPDVGTYSVIKGMVFTCTGISNHANASEVGSIAYLAGIGETHITIPPGVHSISGGLSLSGVKLQFIPGAKLTGTATITIDAPENIIADSDSKLFESGVEIKFSHGGKRYAAWWGFSTSANGATNLAALNAALNAAEDVTSGGLVELPGGEFTVAPGVTPAVMHTELRGQGAGGGYSYEAVPRYGTILKFTAGTNGFDLTSRRPGSNGFTVRDMMIDGDGVLTNGFKSAGEKRFLNVTVESCTGAGWYFDDLTNQTKIVDCLAVECGKGLAVYGSNTTIYQVIRSNFRQNTIGMYIEGGYNATFRDCVIEANSSHGLQIYKPAYSPLNLSLRNMKFDTCWFEGNNTSDSTGSQVIIGSESLSLTDHRPINIIFDNCRFNAAYTDQAFRIDSVNGAYIENCYFYGGTVSLRTNSEDVIFGPGNIFDSSTINDIGVDNVTQMWDDKPVFSEGSWTPTYTCTTTDPTLTYDIQTGGYTKIFNRVHIQGVISTDAVTVAGVGNLRISGLGVLFSPISSSQGFGVVNIGLKIGFDTIYPGHGYINGDGDIILYYEAAAGGGSTAVPASALLDGATKNKLFFSGEFIIAP